MQIEIKIKTCFPLPVAYNVINHVGNKTSEIRVKNVIEVEQCDYILKHNLPSLTQALAIRAKLAPFEPKVVYDGSLANNRLEWHLGCSDSLDELSFEISGELKEEVAAFATEVAALTPQNTNLESSFIPLCLIGLSENKRFFGDYFHLLLTQRGYKPALVVDGADDDKIRVHLPSLDTSTTRFPIHINASSHQSLKPLIESFEALGFNNIVFTNEGENSEYRLDVGPLSYGQYMHVQSQLISAIQSFLASEKVDSLAFPLKIAGIADDFDQSDCEIKVHIPLPEHRAGVLEPYAGDFLTRLHIKLVCDDVNQAEEVVSILTSKGFRVPDIQIEDLLAKPFSICCDFTSEVKQSLGKLKTALVSHMRDIGAPDDYEMLINDNMLSFEKKESRNLVTVTFPTKALDSDKKKTLVYSPNNYKLRICTVAGQKRDELAERFREHGFSRIEFNFSNDSKPILKYGGAPKFILNQVEQISRDVWQLEEAFELNKEWPDRDNDIYIELPDFMGSDTICESEPTMPTWDVPAITVDRTFIQEEDGALLVGDIRLPINTERCSDAPHRGDYQHFCVGQSTANTLHFIAKAVELNEPCFLIGPTATSKTTSIYYIAALLRQPVVRINFSNYSDNSDLIGRYTPYLANKGDESELTEHYHALSEQSKRIIDNAKQEQRSLTKFEYQLIISREGISEPEFTWIDGAVIKAMRQGAWLVLDELNLVPSSVIERLNSLFEKPSYLQLNEHNNEVVTALPRFRVFATANGQDYSGRKALSPALMDRFVATSYLPQYDESSIKQIISYWLTGIQPNVLMNNVSYAESLQQPCFPVTGSFISAEALSKLSRFHVGVQYLNEVALSFSLRTLLSLFEFIEHGARSTSAGFETLLYRAIKRYYFERAQSDEAKCAMQRYLTAIGFDELFETHILENVSNG